MPSQRDPTMKLAHKQLEQKFQLEKEKVERLRSAIVVSPLFGIRSPDRRFAALYDYYYYYLSRVPIRLSRRSPRITSVVS